MAYHKIHRSYNAKSGDLSIFAASSKADSDFTAPRASNEDAFERV